MWSGMPADGDAVVRRFYCWSSQWIRNGHILRSAVPNMKSQETDVFARYIVLAGSDYLGQQVAWRLAVQRLRFSRGGS